MKRGIHPKYGKVTLKIGEDQIDIMSAYNRGSSILVDVDFRRHPAWCGGADSVVRESNTNISKFKSKFAGLGSIA